MKNKNAKNLNKMFGIKIGFGVFLLVGFLVWFGGWKIFGNVSGIDIGIKGPVLEEDNNDIVFFFTEKDYPVMVMFDNAPESRSYQSGLQEALFVYEALAEGGSTRISALYSGAPESERIGPVRSARPYFVEIAAGWSAFYLHAGGSPEGLELIPKTDVKALNEISGLGVLYFWRDPSIARPHNLFTSGELIKNGLSDFKIYNLPEESKLDYKWGEVKITDTSERAQSIYIDFSEGKTFDVSYEYSQDIGGYLRSVAGFPHIDRETDSQIMAKNVVIQKVPKEKYYPSGYGRIILEVTGEGDAIFFRDGIVVFGRWRKESISKRTEFLDIEGNEIVLSPGQTWVEIVTEGREVLFE